MPIIRSIKEGLIANKINRIYGIFNGTSNYVLSSMDSNKTSFHDTMKSAIKLGYASQIHPLILMVRMWLLKLKY